jgi:rod shape-determining protein MreC
MARTSRTGTRTDLALLGAALLVALAALVLPNTARGRVQGALRSSIAAPLVAAQAWAERGRQAITTHGRLVRNVDSLALAAQAAAPLRAENERLRKLIGLGQRLQWGFVATELLQPARGADEHTVLLAAGTSAGIRAFSPLVVPEGLVGMVTTADASSSTAILWTHPDFRASATTVDGAAFGIVAAHLGVGADRFLLEMRNVPFRTELKPGTLIVRVGQRVSARHPDRHRAARDQDDRRLGPHVPDPADRLAGCGEFRHGAPAAACGGWCDWCVEHGGIDRRHAAHDRRGR